MALTTRTIPALMNGISRQPAILRSPDQTAAEENTWGEIALGLSRRPPTTIIKKLSGLNLSGATIHHINRDVTERYTVIIKDGSIQVFDDATGSAKTVSAPRGWGYLNAGADGAYRAVTIADYTFIVNTKKVVALLGVGADQVDPNANNYWIGGTTTTNAHTANGFVEQTILIGRQGRYAPNPTYSGGLTGTVKKADDLPATVCSGCVYKVIGADSTSFVSYYVMGDGVVWNETVAPGLKNSIDETTMPWALVRKADGTFEFSTFSWQPRRVGDLTSNPYPPFVGRTIRDILFYQNRLGFLSDESVTFSAAGDYGEFFRKTVLDYIDSDTLSAAASTQDVNLLDYAVPFSDGIMLFSRQRQFSLTNGDSGLSAHSLAIQPVTTYVMSPKARPAALGSVVYFTADASGYSTLLEYTRLAGSDPTEAADVSAHVPGLLPQGVSQVITAPDRDAVFILVKNATDPADQSSLFAYEFFWDGNKKLKSAWRKWTFNGGVPISGSYSDAALHLLISRNDGYWLEKIDLDALDTAADQDHQIFLDRSKSVTGTYSSVTGKTTFTLPYTPVDLSKVRLVRTKTAPLPETIINPASYEFSGSTVRVVGNESGAPVTIGDLYESRVTLSEQFPQDWQGRPLTSGRLVLHTFTVNVTDTAYLRAEVFPYGKEAAALEPGLKFATELGTRTIGTTSIPDTPIYYNGPFNFSVAAHSKLGVIDLVNDSPFSSTIVSGEWEGLYYNRAT